MTIERVSHYAQWHGGATKWAPEEDAAKPFIAYGPVERNGVRTCCGRHPSAGQAWKAIALYLQSAKPTRAFQVLQLAQQRGEISTADVMRLLDTNVHDAGRLLCELRTDGLLEAELRINAGHGRHLVNRLTDAGRDRLCGRVCKPDFGPLIAAFGR